MFLCIIATLDITQNCPQKKHCFALHISFQRASVAVNRAVTVYVNLFTAGRLGGLLAAQTFSSSSPLRLTSLFPLSLARSLSLSPLHGCNSLQNSTDPTSSFRVLVVFCVFVFLVSLFVFSSVAGSKSRRMFVAHLPPDAQNHHFRYKSGTQTDRQTFL